MNRHPFAVALAFAFAITARQETPKPAPKGEPAAPQAEAPTSGWRVLERHKLGGEGSWDYLTFDPAGGRLFIARASHVMVVDVASGKVTGDIPDTQGVHGVALAPELNRGFTSNGRDHNVTVFDLKTLKPLVQPPTSEGPDAILFEPTTKRVFAFNGRGHDTTVIEAETHRIAGTVPLGGKPEAGVFDAGKVYVNIEDKSEIVAIDAAALKVLARWPIAPGEEPTGLAIDVKSRRLFSACHNEKLVVVDVDSGKVVTTVPIGKGVDGCAFDPGEQLVFTSNGDGTLTVIHEDSPDKYTVVANVPTQKGARTLALDPVTHHVFLVTAELTATPPPQPPGVERQRQRPSYLPDTFTLLIVGK